MGIHEITENQHRYFFSGKTRPVEFRISALRKLQRALRENEDGLCTAMMQDFNKPPFETYMTEIGIVLDEIRFHIRHLPRWSRERKVRTPLSQFHAKSFLSPEPYGVVLIIAPWNYPIHLCLEPLIGAISGGNCAVLKPSAYTPSTSRVLAKIISDIFDPAYITVVEGGRNENQVLLDEKFDSIFFTGSVAVGKTVMEAASKNLTPVTLELGGKSPVIVTETANLRLAAKRIAFGKVLNAGQTCVEPDYLMIHESVRDRFLTEYANALKDFFPSSDMSDMPVIVNEKHFKRLVGLMDGESKAIGGGYAEPRRFIEPTVLIDVKPESPIMQEEIFGPILPVMTYTDIETVIEYIRSHPKPLALYLFTSSKAMEDKILETCSFGGGCINDTIIHLATPHMGFGGVGYSGMGQYHGKLSFDTFTHYRSIVKKSTWLDLSMRYHPYTDGKFKLIKRFLK
ncbi:aldehyde dehydrogenase [Dehalobacter restrictus]|jgi:aldehyde dehydrogenase (NAD+)|uniref:Aldehyde dehydrogenase n=1 Tax=Dehalobacter restrictus (strain DSM 9455 / PER-K23) TaxID=871738 RepID=A0ABM5P479_DEHRP|nr:aldehyde dehydrogenase [Dehalobacter restrictus]AHF09330.1 aldehyde dehydrogenase [Dehalobacter restrictus DSM 9455]